MILTQEPGEHTSLCRHLGITGKRKAARQLQQGLWSRGKAHVGIVPCHICLLLEEECVSLCVEGHATVAGQVEVEKEGDRVEFAEAGKDVTWSEEMFNSEPAS